MKSILSLVIFLFISYGTIKCQSVERFIRIIGNSSYTFVSSGTRVLIKVSETKSDYRNKKASTFEESLAELKYKLDSLKIKSDLTLNQTFRLDYTDTKNKDYSVDLTSQTDLNNIIEIQNPKYSIKKVSYLYSEPKFDVEDKLAGEAIKDAKEKAAAICLKLGKKIGDVLNIETKSNGCCYNATETNNPTEEKKYSVTVTFALLNQ